MSEFEAAEAVLREVIERISPAVLEIAARKDSGHIQIHFGTGSLKFAKKEVTI